MRTRTITQKVNYLEAAQFSYRLEQTNVKEYLGLQNKTKYSLRNYALLSKAINAEILNSIETRPRCYQSSMVPGGYLQRFTTILSTGMIVILTATRCYQSLKRAFLFTQRGQKHYLSRPEDAGLLMLFGYDNVANIACSHP